LEWAKKRNHAIGFSNVHGNQPLPETAENIDLLIVSVSAGVVLYEAIRQRL